MIIWDSDHLRSLYHWIIFRIIYRKGKFNLQQLCQASFNSDFEPKFVQKNLNGKNFERTNVKTRIRTKQCMSVLNLVHLKNFQFWDDICPKKLNGKKIEIINAKNAIG